MISIEITIGVDKLEFDRFPMDRIGNSHQGFSQPANQCAAPVDPWQIRIKLDYFRFIFEYYQRLRVGQFSHGAKYDPQQHAQQYAGQQDGDGET